jgi:hypothetical protein
MLLWLNRCLQTRLDRSYTGGRFAAFKLGVVEVLTSNLQSEHLVGPLFVLHDGPPYANGRIHMGNRVFCSELTGEHSSLSRSRTQQDNKGYNQPV